MKLPHLATKKAKEAIVVASAAAILGFSTFFTSKLKADPIAQPPAETTLVKAMYEGDSSVVKTFDNPSATLSFKAHHQFPQKGGISDLLYSVQLSIYLVQGTGGKPQTVRLFENGSLWTVGEVDGGLQLTASDPDNKYQKIVLLEGQPAKFILKDYTQESYGHISIQPQSLHQYLITFKDSLSPLNELSVSPSADRPLVGVYFNTEKDVTLPVTLGADHPIRQDSTLYGTSLRARVFEREEGDEKSNKFIYTGDGVSNFIAYSKEFVMNLIPVTYKTNGELKCVNQIWYLADSTGRTFYNKDGRWHVGGVNLLARPPPLNSGGGQGENNYTTIGFNLASNINNLESLMLYIRGPPMVGAIGVSFSWPGKDIWNIQAPYMNWDLIKNHSKDTLDTSGFYRFESDQLPPYPKGAFTNTHQNVIYDGNSFRYSIISKDSLQMEFWDNEKKAPTMSFGYQLNPYAKDTNTYHIIRPSVSYILPQDHDTTLSINGPITLHFNMDMDKESVRNTLKLFNADTLVPTFFLQEDNRTYSLTPRQTLAYATWYQVRLSGSASTTGITANDTTFDLRTVSDPSSVVETSQNSALQVSIQHEQITIQSDNPYKRVRLYDMMGRTISSQSYPGGRTHSDLPINALPSGLYLLRVDDQTFKVLKE